MVFQNPLAAFDPRLTMAEAMAEGLRALRPQWSAPERQGRIDAMVRRVGLDPALLDRLPGALSGGQCQRFAIARALVIEPRVLVCDEPTSSLDGPAQARILDLLRSLQRETGVSMLFITHDASTVAAVADAVAVMDAGRITGVRACRRTCADRCGAAGSRWCHRDAPVPDRC
jgi:peptide/nickel transport system ATP-binding protein